MYVDHLTYVMTALLGTSKFGNPQTHLKLWTPSYHVALLFSLSVFLASVVCNKRVWNYLVNVIFLWCWSCEISCYVIGVNRFLLFHRAHFGYFASSLFLARRFTVVIWTFSPSSSVGHGIHCLHSAACCSYSKVLSFSAKMRTLLIYFIFAA